MHNVIRPWVSAQAHVKWPSPLNSPERKFAYNETSRVKSSLDKPCMSYGGHQPPYDKVCIVASVMLSCFWTSNIWWCSFLVSSLTDCRSAGMFCRNVSGSPSKGGVYGWDRLGIRENQILFGLSEKRFTGSRLSLKLGRRTLCIRNVAGLRLCLVLAGFSKNDKLDHHVAFPLEMPAESGRERFWSSGSFYLSWPIFFSHFYERTVSSINRMQTIMSSSDKFWVTPLLTCIQRNQSQECVLSACKMDPNFVNPSGQDTACMEIQTTCAECTNESFS